MAQGGLDVNLLVTVYGDSSEASDDFYELIGYIGLLDSSVMDPRRLLSISNYCRKQTLKWMTNEHIRYVARLGRTGWLVV